MRQDIQPDDASERHDAQQSRDFALRPEWQLRLEKQTEWWDFPLLSATGPRNADFTIHFSYNPIERPR
jgi:hypothetical protein